jgi:hypothetical protein
VASAAAERAWATREASRSSDARRMTANPTVMATTATATAPVTA